LGDKNDDKLYIHQDAKISLGRFEKGESFEYELEDKNKGVFIIEWIVARVSFGW